MAGNPGTTGFHRPAWVGLRLLDLVLPKHQPSPYLHERTQFLFHRREIVAGEEFLSGRLAVVGRLDGYDTPALEED